MSWLPVLLWAMRTSLVAGEAVVGDGRVGGRSRRHRSEGVVAGVGVGYMCAARPTERRDIPQMVGVSIVEHPRRRAHLRLHGHDLSAEPVGRANGIRSRRRVGQFVVGEGGVDDRPVGLRGHHPLAVGVVFGCSGAKFGSPRMSRWLARSTPWPTRSASGTCPKASARGSLSATNSTDWGWAMN